MNDFEHLYKELSPFSKLNDFTSEAAMGVELLSYVNGLHSFVALCQRDSVADSTIAKSALKQIENAKGFFKNYYLPADKKTFIAMISLFRRNVPDSMQPLYLKTIDQKYGGDVAKYADFVYSKSYFASQGNVETLFTKF